MTPVTQEFNPFDNQPQTFDRELIPEGPYAARCARVIEIGVQSSELYGDQNKAVIALSIPSLKIEINGEEKQRFISKPYGIKVSNSDLSKMKQYAQAFCPDGGKNLGDFINKPCQIYVKHRPNKTGDRVFEDINSISPILPSVEVPELDTEPFWFQWNKPDPEVWKRIPEFTQNLIKQAANYSGSFVEDMVRSLGDQSTQLTQELVENDVLF